MSFYSQSVVVQRNLQWDC